MRSRLCSSARPAGIAQGGPGASGSSAVRTPFCDGSGGRPTGVAPFRRHPFQFSDYGKLTVIGVTTACLAWPVVTRISSQPRWLFLRLAMLVTLFLWLPDLWILVHGEPLRGVGVLMLMHLAIAFITYNALVRINPVPRQERPKARIRS